MKLGQMARFHKRENWLTERYYDYITGERSVEKERDALEKIMTRPERVREGSFSASAAGACLRQRQFRYLVNVLKLQQQYEPKSMSIFMHGDYVHLKHQVAGVLGGYLEATEVFQENTKYNLKGTADGITTDGRIAEFKSINDRGFSRVVDYGPQDNHILQINSYLFLLDMDEALILYENKNDQSLAEYRVRRDEQLIKSITDDLERLQEATASKHLLPMLPACVKKEGFAYRYCPFAQDCPKMTDAVWLSA